MEKINGLKLKIKNSRNGFTLIELMIVMTVIAILAAMVLFGLGAAQKNARDVQREANMRAVQTALQAYASDNSGAYPSTAASQVWAAGAGNLFNATVLGAYITKLTDPGCGGTSPVNLLTTGTVGTCATYTYTYGASGVAGTKCTSATGYFLTLAKEAGGSLEFCSPQ